MSLPPPRAALAGCVWLPRILAKARRLEKGSLPPEYAARFCGANGVDEQFLHFFSLTREDILSAVALNDSAVVEWFLALPSAGPDRVAEWNHLAVNLGRPGFPMAERLPVALSTTYRHLDASGLSSVFEALEEDEKN